MKVLMLGQYRENEQEVLREKMRFFGSLVNGDRGNILAGSLNEARIESFWDLLEAMLPYRKIDREKSGESQPKQVDDETSRAQFIKEYQDMVQKGAL